MKRDDVPQVSLPALCQPTSSPKHKKSGLSDLNCCFDSHCMHHVIVYV